MYMPGRGGMPPNNSALGLPGGWGNMMRSSVSASSVGAAISASADILGAISMFDVKPEPNRLYSTASQSHRNGHLNNSSSETSTHNSITSLQDHKDSNLTADLCSKANNLNVPGDNNSGRLNSSHSANSSDAPPHRFPKNYKPQSCRVCGKMLSSSSSYYVHMKLHSGNKPYSCSCCDASFCRKPYLEVHVRTHTGERPYSCELCPDRFSQKSALNTHKRVHTGERPYSCEICSESFTQKSSLTTHERIHTGEKPYQCELCMKRFTQKSSLNTHKRMHTGERPYACDICEKRFAVKSYVTAHRWSHVADKPLTCDQCSLSFASKSQFASHIRTHSSSQSFGCNLCGRTFIRDAYLIRHQNRVHRDRDPNNRFFINNSGKLAVNASTSPTQFLFSNSTKFVNSGTQMSPSHQHQDIKPILIEPKIIEPRITITSNQSPNSNRSPIMITSSPPASSPAPNYRTNGSITLSSLMQNRPRGRPTGSGKKYLPMISNQNI